MAEYLTNGAKLKCSAGQLETDFVVSNAKKVLIQNKAAGNETDNKIIQNVPVFGPCKLQPNGSNFFPCNTNPATLQWQACKNDVTIGGTKAVVDTSFLTCSVGGIIKPSDSGQK
ncbi:DUF4280 domain-containing protein [Flavobacterium sp. T12S277]|uniref:DUF4280 domain-containing protein n=1 Tax=Flavobacterium sp. T12S277 TaxID=3402752 RepID=UPI003AEE9837